MKVAYLIINERPGSGLLNTQVEGLLKELSKNKELNLSLVAIWQPWVYIKYFHEIKELKKRLHSSHISLKSLPFSLPSRYFFTNNYLLNVSFIYTYILLKIIGIKNYKIVHCRGYFISYIASLIKKNNKLIFDMRSLFPEENISAGNWSKEDFIYKKWKDIEKRTIDKSDIVVGVSKPMVDLVSKEYNTSKVVYIPILFKKNFLRNRNKRKELRSQLKIEDKTVFVYSGSLELDFWNDIRIYIKYFDYINSITQDTYFLILTGSNHQVIRDNLQSSNISNYYLNSVSSKDMAGWLSAGDIGIQVMGNMPDSKTRFGVKTVEYLAAGLPIVTNSNVGGIVDLIKKESLGVVVDNKDDLTKLSELIKNHSFYNSRCEEYANKTFEVNKISDEYLNYYRKLY